METSRNYFTYEPFGQCRLLELQPDRDFTAVVKARVYNVHLSQIGTEPNDEKYETLSYVWGEPRDTTEILLQGRYSKDYRNFSVTKNLDIALRHLRHVYKPRTLWVDAICINQKDLAERAEQVTLMSQIYENAVHTLLWLGEESQASKEAFDLLRNLRVTPMDDQYGEDKAYYRSGLVVDPAGEFRLKAMIRGFSKETWQSFRETLSQRPAWNRVWILQEIVLAREVLILCGRREVSWDTLRRFLDACMEVSTDYTTRTINDHVIDAIDRAYYIYFYREARRGFAIDRNSLTQTWRSFSSWDSTDPRDRLFALLSICSRDPTIKPDYTKPAEDLFRATVRAAISGTRNLDVLCLGHPIGDEDAMSHSEEKAKSTRSGYSLPSWVPDFGKATLLANPHLYRYRRDPYSASGDLKAPLVHVQEESGQRVNDTLALPGVFLDKITALNPAKTRERRKFEDLQSLVRGVQEIKEIDRIMWASHGQTVSFSYKEHGPSTGYDGIGNWLISRPQPPHIPSQQESGIETDGTSQDFRCDATVGQDFPSVMVCLAGYVFGTTTKGLQCMVPEHSKPGDTLCILYGSKVPHVLREVGIDHYRDGTGDDGPRYHLIGTAYVHDLMHGEALKHGDEASFNEQVFQLA